MSILVSRLFWGGLMVTPIVAHIVLMIIGLAPLGSIILSIPLVVLAIYGLVFASEDERLDPNGDRYDNVIDLLKGFPEDWTFKDVNQSRTFKYRVYDLHNNIAIYLLENYVWKNSGYENEWVKDMKVEVVVNNKVVTFKPNKGYQARIRRAIASVHHYLEMKAFASHALDASERRRQAEEKVVDRVQVAIKKLKERTD